jgi:hypothetical protein
MTLSCAPEVSVTATRFEVWDGSRISFVDPSAGGNTNTLLSDYAKAEFNLSISKKSHDVPAQQNHGKIKSGQAARAWRSFGAIVRRMSAWLSRAKGVD